MARWRRSASGLERLADEDGAEGGDQDRVQHAHRTHGDQQERDGDHHPSNGDQAPRPGSPSHGQHGMPAAA